jgi:hypothetical protein
MTHPTREDWMSFLYNESPSGTRAQLQAHLDGCAECRAQLATWQQAAQQMSEWKMQRRRKTSATPVLPWAIAAAFVALAAVGAVQLVSLGKEVKQLRASLPGQVRQELNTALAQVAERASRSASAEAQSLIAAVAEKLEEKRLTDQQATFTALQKLNAQRLADYAALRKELETVAVFSEAGLQRAENQISSLTYTPANFSNNK